MLYRTQYFINNVNKKYTEYIIENKICIMYPVNDIINITQSTIFSNNIKNIKCVLFLLLSLISDKMCAKVRKINVAN